LIRNGHLCVTFQLGFQFGCQEVRGTGQKQLERLILRCMRTHQPGWQGAICGNRCVLVERRTKQATGTRFMEAAACFLCEWLRWRSRPLTPEEAADFIDLCANRDNQNLKERGGDIDNQQVNQGRYVGTVQLRPVTVVLHHHWALAAQYW